MPGGVAPAAKTALKAKRRKEQRPYWYLAIALVVYTAWSLLEKKYPRGIAG